MDLPITRRDFLGAALLGAGGMLLGLPAPALALGKDAASLDEGWYGYGGVGDYALAHGNAPETLRAAAAVREGKYEGLPPGVTDTGETYDLVVVGGGLSGLGAAWHFMKGAGRGRACLIIENHPAFGGQARRNEFLVEGHRLMGPQASNSFVVVENPGEPGHELFAELGVPREFRYQDLSPGLGPLEFDRTSYGFMLWSDISPSVGYHFGGDRGWVRDIWGRGLEGTPYDEGTRRDLLRWRSSTEVRFAGGDPGPWLDGMTYGQYLRGVMGLCPEVARFADPILASGLGLGSDAISAYGAYQIAMPGFQGFARWRTKRRLEESGWHSFPGGNTGFARHLVKALIPAAIKGGRSFKEIMLGPVEPGALDAPGAPVRMRLASTAVAVRHEGGAEGGQGAEIVYLRDGGLYRVRARAVVMASANWLNRRVARGLPHEYLEAMGRFIYSPVLVVNVALRNWRPLHRLGITGCRWFSGFGFSCNIRRPMVIDGEAPPLHPDRPVVLTFYVPLFYPGLPPEEQGRKGRKEILGTSYRQYEARIRRKMVELFGGAGFDPRRDMAGIVLNRWAFAYLNPTPGFYFGGDGRPAPSDVLRRPFGRVAFAHSELNGHQHWQGALGEGRRAAGQALQML